MLNVVYDPFLTRKTPFLYSVHTFTRIRQHYFSKYWGGRPPNSNLGGTVPQSPPRSPLLRGAIIIHVQHEWMNEWIEWMNEWIEWIEWIEWLNELNELNWMNEWMNEWVNEWMNEWIYPETVTNTVVQLLSFNMCSPFVNVLVTFCGLSTSLFSIRHNRRCNN